MNAQQKAERLAMIKAAAKKFNRRKELRARLEAGAQRVRKWTDEVEKPARKAAAAKFDKVIDGYNENHNHWTDASSYAKEYYGDRMHQTTRFDNDWD